MKKYISKSLKIVALFYMGFPILYILGCAVLFDGAVGACVHILLSPSFYLISAVAIAAGYGLWEMKRWAWYLFVAANFLIGYENAEMANQFGDSSHKFLAFAVSMAIVALLVYRVAREVRVPYFFPKIRWWESDPRYRLSVQASVTRSDGTSLSGEIMDISMGGCFIKIRSEIRQHEEVKLNFLVFGLPIECHGAIVWLTQSTVTHPRGIGIKFQPLPRTQRRTLRVVNHRLKKIAAFYKRSRYLLNQEDFLSKLQELESAAIEPRKRRRARVG